MQVAEDLQPDRADRMLADPRAVHKTREILHQWLNLGRIHDVTKNAGEFPGFDTALVADFATRRWLEQPDGPAGAEPQAGASEPEDSAG